MTASNAADSSKDMKTEKSLLKSVACRELVIWVKGLLWLVRSVAGCSGLKNE